MRFACLGNACHGLYCGNWIHTDGSFAGKGNGIGSVVDGVCHVGNLCARWAGVADHGIEHLRGGDNRTVGAVAGFDDLLLQVRNLVRGNLYAQVAAGNHHGIGDFDDFFDVIYCMRVFDFRYDSNAFAAVFCEESANGTHVFATAYE